MHDLNHHIHENINTFDLDQLGFLVQSYHRVTDVIASGSGRLFGVWHEHRV